MNRLNILGLLLVLSFLSLRSASAQKSSQSLDSAQGVSSHAVAGTASVVVQPGPLENDRVAMLAKIREAESKGVGIQSYLATFLNIESMVGKGAPAEDIRTRLDALGAYLDKQLSVLAKARNRFVTPSNAGILGLKFNISADKFPEVMRVFPDGPAAIAELKVQDKITQVDGRPTEGLDSREIYRMLVGLPATKVSLTIRRGDTTSVKTLTRMRAEDFGKIHPDIWKMYQSDL